MSALKRDAADRPAPAPEWPDWAALIERLPALAVLLDELRDYLKLHRDPVLCWYGPAGLRARVRDTIAAAREQGIELPPDAELVAVDRLVGELFSRPLGSRGLVERRAALTAGRARAARRNALCWAPGASLRRDPGRVRLLDWAACPTLLRGAQRGREVWRAVRS